MSDDSERVSHPRAQDRHLEDLGEGLGRHTVDRRLQQDPSDGLPCDDPVVRTVSGRAEDEDRRVLSNGRVRHQTRLGLRRRPTGVEVAQHPGRAAERRRHGRQCPARDPLGLAVASPRRQPVRYAGSLRWLSSACDSSTCSSTASSSSDREPTKRTQAPSAEAAAARAARTSSGTGRASNGSRSVARRGMACARACSAAVGCRRPTTVRRATSSGSSGPGLVVVSTAQPSSAKAIRACRVAAPQLTSRSRPDGSSTGRARDGSSWTDNARPSQVKRHGWLLWTDGAKDASSTTVRTSSSSAVNTLLSSPSTASPPSGPGPGSPMCGGTVTSASVCLSSACQPSASPSPVGRVDRRRGCRLLCSDAWAVVGGAAHLPPALTALSSRSDGPRRSATVNAPTALLALAGTRPRRCRPARSARRACCERWADVERSLLLPVPDVPDVPDVRTAHTTAPIATAQNTAIDSVMNNQFQIVQSWCHHICSASARSCPCNVHWTAHGPPGPNVPTTCVAVPPTRRTVGFGARASVGMVDVGRPTWCCWTSPGRPLPWSVTVAPAVAATCGAAVLARPKRSGAAGPVVVRP